MNQKELGKIADCPVCFNRKQPSNPVCGSCYTTYRQEATVSLLEGKPVTIHSWIDKKIQEARIKQVEELERLEKELSEARQDVELLQNSTREEATKFIGGIKGVEELDELVRNDAIKQKARLLFTEQGGNKKWGRLKGLEEQVTTLRDRIGVPDEQLEAGVDKVLNCLDKGKEEEPTNPPA
jgi:hypothetical protein